MHRPIKQKPFLRPIAVAAFLLAGQSLAETGLTLTGRFEQRSDPLSLEMLGNAVCFFPDAESAKLLPRSPRDTRLTWFCFTNTKDAERMLGLAYRPGRSGCGYTGQATVQVTHYKPYRESGDGFDTALLQSADKVSDGAVLPCE